MKRTYINPQIEQQLIAMEKLICVSLGMGSAYSGGEVLSRRRHAVEAIDDDEPASDFPALDELF